MIAFAVGRCRFFILAIYVCGGGHGRDDGLSFYFLLSIYSCCGFVIKVVCIFVVILRGIDLDRVGVAVDVHVFKMLYVF
jgi:hypothetical protein